MIRPLERRDLPELVALCREHAAYERSEFTESETRAERLGELFLDGGAARCWVAEAGDSPGLAGFVTANLELATWDAAPYVHLDCLFLRERARGGGLGRALVECVARWALDREAVNVQWQTPAWNEGAIRFYRRLGATEKEKLRFTLEPAACAALLPGGENELASGDDGRHGNHADRWAPREVRPLGVHELSGWRAKVYGLALEGDEEAAWFGARRVAARQLRAIDDHGFPNEHLAVVVLHRGTDSWWLLVEAWMQGGMLSHHLFSAPRAGSGRWERAPARGPSFCVWELAVLGFERSAWVEHVFAAEADERARGRSAYLETWLEGSV